MPHPERIYQATYDKRWAEVVTLIHEHADAIGGDPRLQRAADMFEDALFDALDEDIDEELADALETLVLLHSGDRYVLSGDRFQASIAALVEWHEGQGRRRQAAQYARFCPEAEVCAQILDQVQEPNDRTPSAPPSRTLACDSFDQMTVTKHEPLAATKATTGLFKSPQEATFFRAAREVFPTYTPYPNVALSSVIDYAAIEPDLSSDERSYFFRGVIDCVLVDPHEGYRPVYWFELDSAHHDEPEQKRKDEMKNRIVSLAGHTLYRIRPHVAVDRHDFIDLLRECIAEMPARRAL